MCEVMQSEGFRCLKIADNGLKISVPPKFAENCAICPTAVFKF